MNVALSSRHTVHTSHDNGTGPKCHNFGAPHGSENYRPTSREVSCKKCLKVLATEAAKEAAYQARLAASLAPATETDDLGHVATPTTEVQAEEVVAANAQTVLIVTSADDTDADTQVALIVRDSEDIITKGDADGTAQYVARYSSKTEGVVAVDAQTVVRVQGAPHPTALLSGAVTVTVDLVTPTKGLIVAGDRAGTVLHTAKREQRPGAGWDVENEYGETVARGLSCLEAAVAAWAQAEGLPTYLTIKTRHEYRQADQRDDAAVSPTRCPQCRRTSGHKLDCGMRYPRYPFTVVVGNLPMHFNARDRAERCAAEYGVTVQVN